MTRKFWEDGPHHCVTCKQKRMGRFCKIIPRGSGWSQGSTYVSFYCWICHPYGTAVRPRETDPAMEPPSSVEARAKGAA